jgi:cytochrome c
LISNNDWALKMSNAEYSVLLSKFGDGVNLVSMAFAGVMFTVGVATAQAPEVLLQHYKCYICHSDHETKTGPAYVDVAAKYRGNPQSVSIVAAVVRKGAHGSGPWHMPPHPEVSDADAKKMARYILSVGPRKIEKKD